MAGGDYSNAAAITYTVMLLLSGMADNVLKPLMLGRGVDAPMPVVLLGALGGMATGEGMFMDTGGRILVGNVYSTGMTPDVNYAMTVDSRLGSGTSVGILLRRDINTVTQGVGIDGSLNNSASALKVYGRYSITIESNTAASEDGFLGMYTIGSGTLAERMRLTSKGNLLLGGTTSAASSTKTLHIVNGTAPSGNIVDGFLLYSADIAAGQASPFFRTEDGGIFQFGTAGVGWNSNTNLNLVSNNTVYAKLLTTGYLELVTGLKLDGATSGALTMIAAGTTTSYTVTMPSAQGGSGTYLKNDGSGNLSWDAPSGSGTVTSIATAGLISGGTITSSGTITTSMSTGKLVGRSTAGTGVMEEITVGSGLTLSGGTLSASGGGGGDFVLISSQDASASATIDFTGLSSTYSTYKIIISNMVSSTNNVIPSLRVGTGGTPTYQTGNVYSWIRIYSAGTVVSGNNTSDSKILIGSNGTQSSTATQSHNMEITIVNPSQSTDYHHVYGKSSFIDSAGTFVMQDFVGVYLSTTAVTAIRIYMSSGNIASGKFNLYGIT